MGGADRPWQTWEDPSILHADTKAKGDNYCLDVCEIGEQIGYTGQVRDVKILGIMSLLDDDQTDWKVVVIDVNDPFASKLHDIEDVERFLPGLLRATNEWFRVHEIPDGKPEKQFAFTGECKNKRCDMWYFLPPLETANTACRLAVIRWISSRNATILGNDLCWVIPRQMTFPCE